MSPSNDSTSTQNNMPLFFDHPASLRPGAGNPGYASLRDRVFLDATLHRRSPAQDSVSSLSTPDDSSSARSIAESRPSELGASLQSDASRHVNLNGRLSHVPNMPVFLDRPRSNEGDRRPLRDQASSQRGTDTIGVLVSFSGLPGSGPLDHPSPPPSPLGADDLQDPFRSPRSRSSFRPRASTVSPLIESWRGDWSNPFSPHIPPISPPADRRAALATATLSVWDEKSPMFHAEERWSPPESGYYAPPAEEEPLQLKATLTWPSALGDAVPSSLNQITAPGPITDFWDAGQHPPPPPPKDPGYLAGYVAGHAAGHAAGVRQLSSLGYTRCQSVPPIQHRGRRSASQSGRNTIPNRPDVVKLQGANDSILYWDEDACQWLIGKKSGPELGSAGRNPQVIAKFATALGRSLTGCRSGIRAGRDVD